MEKLVLERNKEDFYILEVNDKGETIEFDLTDIGLPQKIMKASDNISAIDKEYREKVLELSNQKISDEDKARQIIDIENKKCIELRKEFDSFLGDGACQKIFGDKNYYGMFFNLFDALEPHFNKMEINIKKAKKRLANKYINKEEDVM